MKKHALLRWAAGLLLAAMLLASPLSVLGEILDLPIDMSPGMPVSEKYEIGKMEYDDPSLHVERYYVESKEYACTYYVVRIRIASATQLRTAFAYNFESHMMRPVEDIVPLYNAVLAIDGDYYAEHPGSFVLRQGTLYRDSVLENQDILLIDEDGDFHVVLWEENPGDMDLTEIDGKKIINGFNFGPCIVRDGERMDDASTYAKSPNNSKPWEENQRICIGQTGDKEYIIVACARYGLPLDRFTDLVMSLGDVQTAYMMDGGASTQIVFLGKKVNNTTAAGRNVSDIVYFASAWRED